MLAFAVTIHKSQGNFFQKPLKFDVNYIKILISIGMALSLARMALGSQEKTFGVSFVALSRVKRLTHLLMDYRDLTLDRLQMLKFPDIAITYQALINRLTTRTTTNYDSNDEP